MNNIINNNILTNSFLIWGECSKCNFMGYIKFQNNKLQCPDCNYYSLFEDQVKIYINYMKNTWRYYKTKKALCYDYNYFKNEWKGYEDLEHFKKSKIELCGTIFTNIAILRIENMQKTQQITYYMLDLHHEYENIKKYKYKPYSKRLPGSITQ